MQQGSRFFYPISLRTSDGFKESTRPISQLASVLRNGSAINYHPFKERCSSKLRTLVVFQPGLSASFQKPFRFLILFLNWECKGRGLIHSLQGPSVFFDLFFLPLKRASNVESESRVAKKSQKYLSTFSFLSDHQKEKLTSGF
jgi:hypothetical protein